MMRPSAPFFFAALSGLMLTAVSAPAQQRPVPPKPAGAASTVAVSGVHDRDGNNKLDSNFLGIPRKDWAVSNNARPRFRSPRFSEAQFTLAAGET